MTVAIDICLQNDTEKCVVRHVCDFYSDLVCPDIDLDLLNPRPDGVWQVTGPDEGGGTKGPHPVSPEQILGSENFKRRSKDLIKLPQT